MAEKDPFRDSVYQAGAYFAVPLRARLTADDLAAAPAVLVPGDEGTEGDGAEVALIPGDPGFSNQWHLNNTTNPLADLNVTSVWDDYTGRGVVVGIMDTGIDYNHPDLAPNYRHDIDWDARDRDGDSYASTGDDDHGTAVAGVIAATFGNGQTVGVAPDAQITGFRIGFSGTGASDQELVAISNFRNVDIANNSWGYNGYFYDDFNSADFAAEGAAMRDAVTNGRGGLGTVVTFAAGNSGGDGQDVNYHSYQSSRYTIAVGAISSSGAITSFSTPGAAVLVSAPGAGVYTTDVQGSAGYSAGDYTTLNGASFSSPGVAGVVALMLEANPNLGYRDVQEILAYSALNPISSTSGWQTNGADNWNGGGLTFSHSYGFGLADAHAAVRLAETWQRASTEANVQVRTNADLTGSIAIPDQGTITRTAAINTPLDIDHVEVHLDIDHTYIGDLRVNLTSPDGTTSTLVDRPGNGGASQDDIDFTFTSVAHWGETDAGTWTLTVSDTAGQDVGFLRDWDMTFYGDALSDDDTYIYTDQWGRHGGEASRQSLTDTAGTDTLNFAAVTAALDLSLMPGASNTFMGYPITIGASTTIENVFGGDAGDVISGNAANNEISGMRGADTLSGGAGDDLLTGGAGDDLLSGGAGSDTAVYSGNQADYTVTTGLGGVTVSGSDGTDILTGVEFLRFADATVATSPLTANDDSVTATEDTTLVISAASLVANDSDPNGGALTIAAVGAAAHGSVSINGEGNIVYTPTTDYSGADSFTYMIRNASGDLATATVNVTVDAVADTPTITASAATPRTIDGTSGTPKAFVALNLSGALNDADGSESLSVTVAGVPTGATLSTGTDNGDGTWTLTPAQLGSVNLTLTQNPGSNFDLTVTATATESSNGHSTTASSTVTIDVTGVAPEALAASGVTNEDVALNGQLPGVDFDGDTLTYSVNQGPAHGTVQINADGTYTYTPTTNWSGTDSFTYTVSDGDGSDTGTITVDVTPVADAPVVSVSVGQWSVASIGPGELGGNEFIVNSSYYGDQYNGELAALDGGGFVSVFSSQNLQDYDGLGIFGRLFDSSAQPLGPEFQINTAEKWNQERASVAGISGGGFVVAWESDGQDGDAEGVYARLFDADGLALGQEFRINEVSAGNQEQPQVARMGDNGFVVTWQSEGQDGDGLGVFARRYDVDGNALGGEISVNTVTGSDQFSPRVTVMSDGGFVVTWISTEPNNTGIVSRRFAADGNPVSDEVVVSSTATGFRANFEENGGPDVTELADGRYAVIWDQSGLDGGFEGVAGQIFDASGNPIGNPIQIPADTANGQHFVDAATLSDGTFLVSWMAGAGPASGDYVDVYGQIFDAAGNTVGSRFKVNSHVTGYQGAPDILPLSGNRFVVSWTSDDLDGDHWSISARVFAAGDVAATISAPLDISASLADADGSEVLGTFTVSGLPAGAVLSAGTNNGDGTWTLAQADVSGLTVTMPAAGAANFDVTVTATSTENANGTTAVGTGTATATIGNVAPYAADVDVSIDEDGAVAGTLTSLDYELGSTLTFSAGQGPAHGTVQVNADGSYSYTPDADWSGTDSFTYTVDDGNGATNIGTITVDVAAVADTPTVSVSVGAWTQTRTRVDGSGEAEFILNQQASGNQSTSAVTKLADGGFVVVWESLVQDGDSYGVVGRRYDEFGIPAGDEFIVNSTTVGAQVTPDIFDLADGGFVAVWGDNGIRGQRFDQNGNRVGGEFRANSHSGNKWQPAGTSLADGGFLLTWHSHRPSGDGQVIYGRRFDANGLAVGSDFDVSTATGNSQSQSQITALSDGGFVVVWHAYSRDGSGLGVYAQRFNADNTKAGGEILVNTTTANDQSYPDVMATNDGGFVVAWHGRSAGLDSDIYLQHFASDGSVVGSETVVNEWTPLHQYRPKLSPIADGGYVVTWYGHGDGSNLYEIHGRRFDGAGNPLGSQFQINTYDSGYQTVPDVTPLSNGGFFVTWSSTLQDGDGVAVVGKMFDANGVEIAPGGNVVDTVSAALDITAGLGDTDGSETVASVVISGLPTGATLSAGTDNGDGTWTLSQADLAGLTVTLSGDNAVDFNLSVTATATEGSNGSAASATVTQAVTAPNIAPVAGNANAATIERWTTERYRFQWRCDLLLRRHRPIARLTGPQRRWQLRLHAGRGLERIGPLYLHGGRRQWRDRYRNGDARCGGGRRCADRECGRGCMDASPTAERHQRGR